MQHLLLLLILVPFVIWPWISKYLFHRTITTKEVLMHLAIVFVFMPTVYYIAMVGDSMDTEVWNGQVVSKKKEWVSCEHSYPCNCHAVSCGENCTTTQCDTCYEHSNDWDWRVYSNVDDYENIARIDSRGSNEPPRWTATRIGEPYSDEKRFRNYIKGAPDSLFNSKELVTRYEARIPKYPNNIYDYYKVNRVLPVGLVIPDISEWNSDLSNTLRDLGPLRKSNVVVILTSVDEREYAKAVEAKWLGGKKNDTVIVVGAKNYPQVSFVEVFSWSKNQMFNIELRDRIAALPKIERQAVMEIIHSQVMKNFEKRSMEEFNYLADKVTPPTWVLILTAVMGIAISIGCTYVFHTNEF